MDRSFFRLCLRVFDCSQSVNISDTTLGIVPLAVCNASCSRFCRTIGAISTGIVNGGAPFVILAKQKKSDLWKKPSLFRGIVASCQNSSDSNLEKNKAGTAEVTFSRVGEKSGCWSTLIPKLAILRLGRNGQVTWTVPKGI